MENNENSLSYMVSNDNLNKQYIINSSLLNTLNLVIIIIL